MLLLLSLSFYVKLCQALFPEGVLAPGVLLQLQGLQLSGKFFFFGHAMKKPKVQVLVKGFPVRLEAGSLCVSILQEGCQEPVLCTSQGMFQEILDTCRGNVDSIRFVTHSYTVAPFAPLTRVAVTSTSDEHEFVSGKKAEPKGQVRLGFGLTLTSEEKTKGSQSQSHTWCPESHTRQATENQRRCWGKQCYCRKDFKTDCKGGAWREERHGIFRF